MSSVEIVEVINKLRAPGQAELRHATFMEKVCNHPGIAGQNFLSGYFDPNGQQRPCYYLPKREAELMVMAESLDVQTQVYDRLAEFEAKAAYVISQGPKLKIGTMNPQGNNT
jgi:anti-repressor protein